MVCIVSVFEMIPFWKLLVVLIPFLAWGKILYRRINVPQYPNAHDNLGQPEKLLSTHKVCEMYIVINVQQVRLIKITQFKV